MRAYLPVLLLWGIWGAWPPGAHAWMFHEHVDVTLEARNALSSEELGALQTLWSQTSASPGHQRLCASAFQLQSQAGSVHCVDFAMLPALAADHTCSTSELSRVIRSAELIPRLVSVTRKLAKQQRLGTRTERRAAFDGYDVQLAMVDREYLDRATKAHFLTPTDQVLLDKYMAETLEPGTRLNGLGLYIQMHAVALQLMLRAAEASGPAQTELAQRALLAEAFALHYLQDAFAVGHVVDTRGSARQRKGTHDHFSTYGMRVQTWGVAHPEDPAFVRSHQGIGRGDGFKDDRDFRLMARAVGTSLKQLMQTYLLAKSGALPDSLVRLRQTLAVGQFDRLEQQNICNGQVMAQNGKALGQFGPMQDVLRQTYRPVTSVITAQPHRYSKEIGGYVMAASGLRGSSTFGGFGADSPTRPRWSGAVEVSVGVGMSLDGVATKSVDSASWLQAQFIAETGQSPICDSCADKALVGMRMAAGGRVRVPFLFVPGDGLVAVLYALKVGRPTTLRYFAGAAEGGLWRWQRLITVGKWTMQFVIGRELGLLWSTGYDVKGQPEQHSLLLDLPALEFHSPKVFEGKNSTSVAIQLGYTADFPDTVDPSHMAYLRLRLSARRYLWDFF